MGHAILAFDTVAYANKLKQAGFTEKQAETQAETMAEILTNDLVTKHDLQQGLVHIQEDMNGLKHQMKELEFRLLFKLGSVIVISGTIYTGLLSMFIKLILH